MWQPTETQLTLAAKIVMIAAAPIVLFGQDLLFIVTNAINNEANSYLLAIPFLFAFLIYRKRKILRAVITYEPVHSTKEPRHLPTMAGIFLTIIAILLYWNGSYTATPLEYHMFALPIFVGGLCLILFNLQTLRQLAFPIIFLLFLMPPPSTTLYTVGSLLSIFSSEASNAIINLMGIPTTLIREYGTPTILITRPDGATIPFTVDIACSGIYSLIGFLVFAVFITYIIRDKLWKKGTLLLLGLPVIYAINIIRITIILFLGYHYGGELALQVFHLFGGWLLIFLGTLLLLLISEKVFHTQIFGTEPTTNASCRHGSTQPFCFECGRILKHAPIKLDKNDIAKLVLIPSLIVVLISVQAPVFALTKGSPLVITTTPSGQTVSTGILPQVPGYNLYFVYRDTTFEQLADYDMALIYLYEPDVPTEQPMWVTLEIADTEPHAWQACLIVYPQIQGWQYNLSQIDLREIQIAKNPPIFGTFFAFHNKTASVLYNNTRDVQVVLWWRVFSGFEMDSTSQLKHVKLSLIAWANSTNLDELGSFENQMLSFASAITTYWEPVVTWSPITLLISQNGASLSFVTTGLLLITLLLYFMNTRKLRQTNALAYQKLPDHNKQIIDTIRNIEKTGPPTFNLIAEQYARTTGNPASTDDLLKKLSETEGTGIIKSSIANDRDKPLQTWKTLL